MVPVLLPRAAFPALGRRCTRACQIQRLDPSVAACNWKYSKHCFSSSSPRPRVGPRKQRLYSQMRREEKRPLGTNRMESDESHYPPYSPAPGASIRIKAGVEGDMAEWTQELGLFYNNEFHASMAADNTLHVVDPTLSEPHGEPKVIAHVSYPSIEDMKSITSGARDALHGPWKDYTGTQRAELLNKLADLISQHAHTIATVESYDSGKTFTNSSEWDVPHTINVFRYYASLASDATNEKIDRGDGKWVEIVKSPIGVVAAITPWNYPLAMAAQKLAPALAAGCTVVLKTSEHTPLSMLYVAGLIREAGFPPSVVNVITGPPAVGQALVSDPLISKITFTGSTSAGKAIMAAASENLTPVTLEMGGKSPLVVFEDADVDDAVQHAHEGAFANQGQVCTATSRILVHNSIYQKFLGKLQDFTAERSVVGDPFDRSTFQGPQISIQQYKSITSLLDSARDDAKSSGDHTLSPTTIWQPAGDNLPEKGFFIAPTIVHNLTTDNTLWRKEIFGPVACVMGFDTEEEALKLANDTSYGLAGAVFTKDKDRKRRMASGLQAGTVWVGSNQDCDVRVPFGGWKASGIGREMGRDGLEAYLAKKAIYWSDE